MTDALSDLAEIIRQGLPGPETGVRPILERLFGERYHKRHFEPTIIRDAYGLAAGTGGEEDGVPFAGLIHPDNPPSGPYGGTSLVWFPTREHGSLIGFGVGTRGLSPDEGILTRPGHRRRVAALRRQLARMGVEAWTKPDPSALGVAAPRITQERFKGFERVFQRYGHEMYCNAHVPSNSVPCKKVVQAFLDLYAFERGWQILKSAQDEFNDFIGQLRSDLFPKVDATQVDALLRHRRFVVLQGPPGTGKTRLADAVRLDQFKGRGMTVQFHPAFTYEDFIIGLSPDSKERTLRFDVRPGCLLMAAESSKEGPYLLVIDEVNRADLGKVLGEAIYLFETREIGGKQARKVQLPHPINGSQTFIFPDNLFILATMNTADRSIAAVDIAIRRRFAFVTMSPDRTVVESQDLPLGLEIFDRLTDVFVEHAPHDALDLMPGHAYFLAKDENELKERFRYELLPLLDEYIREGYLGSATTELHAVRDAIEDAS